MSFVNKIQKELLIKPFSVPLVKLSKFNFFPGMSLLLQTSQKPYERKISYKFREIFIKTGNCNLKQKTHQEIAVVNENREDIKT